MAHLSTKSKKNNLGSWSWQDIQAVYKSFGLVLQSYEVVAQRIAIPKAHIQFTDPENIFLLRWGADISRIDQQLKALDTEIARRNQLVGVMG